MQPRPLSYDIAGEGEPLVLLPGGLTGWVSWIPHQQRLCDRYQVIRVQPILNELGSAGKVGDPGYTREVERESVRLTLDELGIDRPHFAGWSNGGRMLLELVVAYPHRVRSLALMEPGAPWVLELVGERHLYPTAEEGAPEALSGKEVSEGDLARFLQLAGLVGDASQAKDHPMWEQWVSHRMALSWVLPELLRSDVTLEDLQAISCPVLLVKGTHTHVWLERVVDVLHQHLPSSQVVQLPGGHAAHIESIEGFLAALDTHLRGVGA